MVEMYPELRERVKVAVRVAVDEVVDVGRVVVARPLPTRIAAWHMWIVRCVSGWDHGEVERLADHLREQALLKIDVVASGIRASADFAGAVRVVVGRQYELKDSSLRHLDSGVEDGGKVMCEGGRVCGVDVEQRKVGGVCCLTMETSASEEEEAGNLVGQPASNIYKSGDNRKIGFPGVK